MNVHIPHSFSWFHKLMVVDITFGSHSRQWWRWSFELQPILTCVSPLVSGDFGASICNPFWYVAPTRVNGDFGTSSCNLLWRDMMRIPCDRMRSDIWQKRDVGIKLCENLTLWQPSMGLCKLQLDTCCGSHGCGHWQGCGLNKATRAIPPRYLIQPHQLDVIKKNTNLKWALNEWTKMLKLVVWFL